MPKKAAIYTDEYIASLPKTRKEALSGSAVHFYTGAPCSRGHLTIRQAVNGICLTCSKENQRRHTERNPGAAAKSMAAKRAAMTEEEKSAALVRRRANWRVLVQGNPIDRWAVHATDAAKYRAKRQRVPYDLTVEYVRSLATENCPALGVPLVYCNPGGIAWNSAQLDRTKPHLGYVKGNVAVLSKRANVIKSDASLEEIEAVYRYVATLEA